MKYRCYKYGPDWYLETPSGFQFKCRYWNHAICLFQWILEYGVDSDAVRMHIQAVNEVNRQTIYSWGHRGYFL
jgi:hypothetical protein